MWIYFPNIFNAILNILKHQNNDWHNLSNYLLQRVSHYCIHIVVVALSFTSLKRTDKQVAPYIDEWQIIFYFELIDLSYISYVCTYQFNSNIGTFQINMTSPKSVAWKWMEMDLEQITVNIWIDRIRYFIIFSISFPNYLVGLNSI